VRQRTKRSRAVRKVSVLGVELVGSESTVVVQPYVLVEIIKHICCVFNSYQNYRCVRRMGESKCERQVREEM
jgi:hypothetical protein